MCDKACMAGVRFIVSIVSKCPVCNSKPSVKSPVTAQHGQESEESPRRLIASIIVRIVELLASSHSARSLQTLKTQTLT